ncbi:MAG: ATP-binding protein [Saccharospirillum sp.]
MRCPETPANETERLIALKRLNILDTGPEPQFDRLTALARFAFGVDMALVSLVDANRQWFKSRQGVDVAQTDRSISFCGHAIVEQELFVVEDAQSDERFHDNPLVTGPPYIRFYAGAQLVDRAGFSLGTLCLLDPKPRTFSADDRRHLRYLADMVERELLNRNWSTALDELEAYRAQQAEQTARQLLALRLLQEISSEVALDMDERMRRALRIGLEYLDMDMGVISQIENDVYSIRWLQSVGEAPIQEQQTLALEDTYCQLLFENDGELAIEQMGRSRYADHRVYRTYGLESYLGTLLTLGDQVVGTLNFSATEARKQPFDDGEHLFMRLLGRWVAADLERNQAQERLNNLMKQVPGMIYQFRLWPDGRSAFPYSSPGIESVYHLTPDAVRSDGSRVYERIHTDDAERVKASVEQSAQQLSPWVCEYRIRDNLGHYRWVAGHATPERTLDGGTVWHGYIHDIDDRKKTEQLKAEFVSTVSHELRTPLTAIGGTLGLITGGALGDVPDRMRDLLSVAHKNTERLTALINDLLDLEKLSAGKLPVSMEWVPVAELKQHSLESHSVLAERYGVALVLAPGDEADSICVDRHRFEQIMANLLSNAVKFSSSGRQVRLGWHRSEPWVTVTVQDQGIGIPETFRNRIFERFSQADSSDRRARGGTGLGLAISRVLVERMHGEIDFESEEGVGTTFYVRFPLYSPGGDATNTETDATE